MRYLAQLRLAVMMLTRLPAGPLPAPAPTLSQSCWAFPLVGLVVGAINWMVFAAAEALGLPPTLVSLLTVLTTALLTGALHFDGLADFADGIGGGRDKEHCLEIMRDSRIGSYGVVALIFAIGIQVAAMTEIGALPDPGASLAHLTNKHALDLAPHSFVIFMVIAVTSRLMMVALLIWLPSARVDGLGHSADTKQPLMLLPGALAASVLLIVLGPGGLTIAGAMAVAAGGVAYAARRRIGGQTGDVLGAAQLTAETAGWLIWAAIIV